MLLPYSFLDSLLNKRISLIILFFILLCLYALAVIVAAVAIFIEEEDIRETLYGEVWDDAEQ